MTVSPEYDKDFYLEEIPEPLDYKVDHALHFQNRKLARGRAVTGFRGHSMVVLLIKLVA